MQRLLCRRFLLVSVMPIAASALVLGSLVFADWTESRHWSDSVLHQLELAIEHGDRLHYVGHLALGRLFDLSPGMAQLAADQYQRAAAHATTARQRALVTSERPQTLETLVSDVGGITVSGWRWAQRGATWLLERATARYGWEPRSST
jgi:hypothetical protein